MQFKIEPLSQQHHGAVVDLVQQNLPGFAVDRCSLDLLWQRFSAQTQVIARVAVKDNIVIGYANLVIEQKIHGDALGHMESLVVSHPYRNQGAGRALTLDLLQVARSHGCYKITCITQPHNVDFWRRCGFESEQIAMQLMLDDSA
jgi:ribosomal protein S18 acetylase RimI-like enzyme